jgi:hypothetical protein
MATMRVKVESKVSRLSQLGFDESSPEKAGVGGSIPSLATTISDLESALNCLSFCLCQICVVNFPD